MRNCTVPLGDAQETPLILDLLAFLGPPPHRVQPRQGTPGAALAGVMSSGRASTSGSGVARDCDFLCGHRNTSRKSNSHALGARRERGAVPCALHRPQIDESEQECFEGLALHDDVDAPDASEAIAGALEAQDL